MYEKQEIIEKTARQLAENLSQINIPSSVNTNDSRPWMGKCSWRLN